MLGAAKLVQRGVTEFMDISRNVPGLNVIDIGPLRKTIFIRGLVGAGESTVGLYYDGMPTSGSDDSAANSAGRQTDLYLFDAQRAEVLRGAQSTLCGSSALAGVVRVLTNPADVSHSSEEVVLDGAATSHDGDSCAIKGVINMPISDDKFAVRMAAYKVHDGGFISKSYLHLHDINGVDQLGARFNAKLITSDRGTLTGQFFVQEMKTADQAIERPFGETIGSTYISAVGSLSKDAHARQPRKDTTQMAGLNYVHNFDYFNLRVAQSYFKRDNTDDQDLAGLLQFFAFLQSINPFPGVPVIPNRIFQFLQETRMNTTEVPIARTLSGPLNGVFGLMYQDRKIRIDNSFLQTDTTSGLISLDIPYGTSGLRTPTSSRRRLMARLLTRLRRSLSRRPMRACFRTIAPTTQTAWSGSCV